MTVENMDRNERFGMAARIITIGFWVNAVLMIMKLLAGYFGNSEAVFADGIESASDFVAILSTLIALKIGRKPFDERHPYGHGKVESISAILVSLVIFAAGAGILYNVVRTITTGTYPEPHLIAVLAAFFTILIKEILYQFTHRISMRLESPAVESIAKDHRKDALTSIATLVGVGGAYCGISFLDPLAAALTAFFIFHIGWKTLRSAIGDLMDSQVSSDVLSVITKIAETVPGVVKVHEIRGRRSGQYIIIDMKLDMDADMTVKQSHEIATQVKRLIFMKISNMGDVMIHINPAHETHEDMIRL